jgi:formate-dependent nitrite reductase membrane component NrfD
VLHPTAVERTPETFRWADVIPLHGGEHASSNGHGSPSSNGDGEASPGKVSKSGEPLRAPQPQGVPWAGPITIGGTMAEHMVQVAYNAQHKIPWHWPVPGYLVTKAIGAGIFMLLSLGLGLNWFEFDDVTVSVAGFLVLLFIGLTTVLLVYDLDKPERFFSILYRPQWRSWLARGAFILVSFSAVAGIWWLLEAGATLNLWSEDVAAAVRPIALWLGLPLAIGTSVYTAYLFSQAEGRDLWQSPLLPVHLLIQAFVAGSGALLVVALFLPDAPERLNTVAWMAFAVALVLDLFVILVGEFSIPHASEVAARAAHEISHGHYRRTFWWGGIALGHVAPLAIALATIWLSNEPLLGAVAGLCAIAGLYAYEYAFVMAPQEIANS